MYIFFFFFWFGINNNFPKEPWTFFRINNNVLEESWFFNFILHYRSRSYMHVITLCRTQLILCKFSARQWVEEQHPPRMHFGICINHPSIVQMYVPMDIHQDQAIIHPFGWKNEVIFWDMLIEIMDKHAWFDHWSKGQHFKQYAYCVTPWCHAKY